MTICHVVAQRVTHLAVEWFLRGAEPGSLMEATTRRLSDRFRETLRSSAGRGATLDGGRRWRTGERIVSGPNLVQLGKNVSRRQPQSRSKPPITAQGHSPQRFG